MVTELGVSLLFQKLTITYPLLKPAAATKMGMVFRNENGSQEFKDNSCADFFFNVGSFQLTLNAPVDQITYLTSGQSLSINATTTESADFTLKANGATINTQNNSSSFSFSPTVSENHIVCIRGSKFWVKH